MSRRSQRFRATVDVPELGRVEVRGLSPDALRGLKLPTPTAGQIDDARKADSPVPEGVVAIIAAGCGHPRLSEQEIRALAVSSREALSRAILTAHPQATTAASRSTTTATCTSPTAATPRWP